MREKPVSASLRLIFIFIKSSLPRQELEANFGQVSTFSSEDIVLGFAEDEDYITGFDSGLLIGIASEGDFVSVCHALVDVYFKNFLF